MKKMLIVSSALALMAAPSFAQDPAYDPATQQPGAGDQRGDQRNGLFDDWFDDGHSLEGTPVYANDGERVGSVERVRGGGAADSYRELADGTTRDLDVTGLVVETGGFLGIGTREVEIQAGNAQRTSVDGEQRIVLDMSNAEFERLREHARDDDDWRTRDRDTGGAARTDTQASATATGSMGSAARTGQTGVQSQAGHDRGTYADDDAFRDDHPLRDVAVYTNDGERVGSVERVRGGGEMASYRDLTDGTTRDLDVDGLVIETGGFLGIGTREVEVQAGSAQRTSVDGEQRILLDMSNAEFERLREHTSNEGEWSGRTGYRADAFRDDHPLRDVAVYSSDGERLGSVERVRGGGETATYRDLTDGTTRDLDVNGLVVETGGFLGIGTREVEVQAGSAQLTSVDGDQRIVLDMSNAEFERLREHARDRDGGMWGDQQRQDDARTETRTQGQTGVQGQAGMQGRADATPQTTTPGQTQRQARASGEVHGDVYTDGHHWVGTPVFSSDGERLGEVHKVRALGDAAYARGGDTVAMTEADPDIDAVVVRTGGFLGFGRREVQIDVDRVELEMEGNQPRLVVDMTADEFGDLPEHDRNSSRAGG